MKTAQEVLKERNSIFEKRITVYGHFISQNLDYVVDEIMDNCNLLNIDKDVKYSISNEQFKNIICSLDGVNELKQKLKIHYSQSMFVDLFRQAVLFKIKRAGFTIIKPHSIDLKFKIE